MSALPSALRRPSTPAGAAPAPSSGRPIARRIARRIAVARAGAALVWAAALAVAVGDDVPTTASALPTLVAVLLTAYPLIDVVASVVEAADAGTARRDAAVLRANAALSALAAVALGVATFGSDAGATLVAFGAWAVVSGAVQLGVAVRRRRTAGRQVPMLVSGGLSALVGVTIAAGAGQDDAHLGGLAGYAAFGAVLYLVWAARARH